MKNKELPRGWLLAALAFGLALSVPSAAEEWDRPAQLGRIEIGLGTSVWPALADLEPLGYGSFDDTGFGVSAGFYVQTRQLEDSELLVGMDASFYAADSSVLGLVGTYSVNHLYVGGAARWRFGERRNMLLDTGVGYHLADISEYDYRTGFEGYVNWEESAIGAYVGATYDFGRSAPFVTRGFYFSVKVHFVDFGPVSDQGNVIGVLGPKAGTLSGPIYQFQFGYGGT
jgi:hypothetical protein